KRYNKKKRGEKNNMSLQQHKHKTTRVSVDLPKDEHLHLKIACARYGIPIHQFVIESIEKNLKALEEQLDAQAFDRGKKEMKAHGTISLEEMDKRLGFDVQD